MRPEEYKIRDFVNTCRAKGIDIDQITAVLTSPEKKKPPYDGTAKQLAVIAICIETVNLILSIVLLLIGLL